MARPLPDSNLDILDTQPERVKNPFSGESIILPPDALAVLDWLYGLQFLLEEMSGFADHGISKRMRMETGSEMTEEQVMSDIGTAKGWFLEYEPTAYKILID